MSTHKLFCYVSALSAPENRSLTKVLRQPRCQRVSHPPGPMETRVLQGGDTPPRVELPTALDPPLHRHAELSLAPLHHRLGQSWNRRRGEHFFRPPPNRAPRQQRGKLRQLAIDQRGAQLQ